MLRFIARRLLETIPVLLIIITATFFMIRFGPGGPFTAEKAVTPEILRNLEAHYGLNKPLYRQYLDYLGSLLRGGLLPVVSFLGPAIAGILTGSFVIETIFQIPGLGREFVNSAFNRDYTLVLGTVILYATLIIVLNLVVDVVQVWLNPKLKFE